MLRDIVNIDEERCDGCGQCVPTCAEGAIRIIDGKARLVSDVLCDGLGECLGHCPQGAIPIERPEETEFSEQAVAAHLGRSSMAIPSRHGLHLHRDGSQVHQADSNTCPSGGGCPSSRFQEFKASHRAAVSAGIADGSHSMGEMNKGYESQQDSVGPLEQSCLPSELTHWPVQLRLLSPSAPTFKNAHMLLAADCVPIAYPEFHRQMLRGRAVVIACPKLDDPAGYLEKLTEMIRVNEPASLTVAHMEVPCCTGILHLALQARKLSGKPVPLIDVVVSRRGDLLARQEIPV